MHLKRHLRRTRSKLDPVQQASTKHRYDLYFVVLPSPLTLAIGKESVSMQPNLRENGLHFQADARRSLLPVDKNNNTSYKGHLEIPIQVCISLLTSRCRPERIK